MARTRRLILREQRVGGENGGVSGSSTGSPPCPGLPLQVAWCCTRRGGPPVQRDQPKQREPKQREQRLDTAFPSGQPQGGLQLCSEEGQCAIFYIGPDLISVEHKSQFWSKRTPGNKAVLWQECLVFLFCCSYFFNNSWFSLSGILGGSDTAELGIVLWNILVKLKLLKRKQRSGRADATPGGYGHLAVNCVQVQFFIHAGVLPSEIFQVYYSVVWHFPVLREGCLFPQHQNFI